MVKILISGSNLKRFLLILLVFVFLGTYGVFAQMRSITGYELVYDMKLGWNLGNSFDALGGDETAWGNPVTTKALIDMLAAKGFKTIRIPVSWGEHVGASPTYTIDPARLDRVQAVVDYCLADGMYAIVNMHHENAWLIPTYAAEAVSTTEMKAIWTQIANRFINYNDYLVFETMNEPRVEGSANEWIGGTAENRDVINHFNQAALDAIRATGGNNASRWVVITTHAATSMDIAIQALVIPNDSHILVSQHTYYPYSLCLDSGGTSTWGTEKEKTDMDIELDRIHDFWLAKGVPVIIGEWGTIDKDNTAVRAAHASYYGGGVRNRGMLGIWWDNGWTGSQGLALINRPELTWHREEIADALVSGVANPVSSPFPGYDCSAVAEWDSATIYATAGMQVTYNCLLYQNNWYSQNQNPAENSGSNQVWTYIGPCECAISPTPVGDITPAPTTPPSVTPDPTTAPTAAPTDAPTDAATSAPVSTDTPAPTGIPTATPGGVTADPTGSPTTPPSVTPDPTEVPTTPPAVTDPPSTGCTCANLCSSQTAITVPFTKDGSGEYCYTSGSLGAYVNSWNTDVVNVNGTSCTNTYISSSSIAAISGVYYIYYKASYSWSHIEIK